MLFDSTIKFKNKIKSCSIQAVFAIVAQCQKGAGRYIYLCGLEDYSRKIPALMNLTRNPEADPEQGPCRQYHPYQKKELCGAALRGYPEFVWRSSL